MAAATAKRLIEQPGPHIRLHDLLLGEARATRERARALPLAGPFRPEEFMRRVESFESISGSLSVVASTIARWAPPEDASALVLALQTAADVPSTNGNNVYLGIAKYPAQLMFYSAGVVAIGQGRFEVVAALSSALLGDPETSRGRIPAVMELVPHKVFVDGTEKVLAERRATAASERIEGAIRPLVLEHFPNERDFIEAFDLFELLLSATYADVAATRYGRGTAWGPPLSFAWRRLGWRSGDGWIGTIEHDLDARQVDSPLLKAGMFGGDLSRARAALAAVREVASKTGWI